MNGRKIKILKSEHFASKLLVNGPLVIIQILVSRYEWGEGFEAILETAEWKRIGLRVILEDDFS